MKKTILIAMLTPMAGLVLSGWVLAQGTPAPRVFSGTITKVDLEKKGIVVQNQDRRMFFQWNHETKVKGSSGEEGGLISKNLKEGMRVTIFYKEVQKNRVASQIAVKESSLETSKGWELPFECGLSVC